MNHEDEWVAHLFFAIAGALYVLDDATVRKMLSSFVGMRRKEENGSSAICVSSRFRQACSLGGVAVQP